MTRRDGAIHTLISLDDFMSLMGVDARDERITRFCLVTSTLSIEGFCKRRFLRKRYDERLAFNGDLFLPLGEYPVSSVGGVRLIGNGGESRIEPGYFDAVPDCGIENDVPFGISLSPFVRNFRGIVAARVDYRAGYTLATVPADLSAACLELASWNLNRYRGRRVGMTGSVAGNWRDGEHFEMSMPENVRALLEPYVRRTI